MTTLLSFHEPGFWLVVSLLCTAALLAGRTFLPPAWRAPLTVANWLGIPFLALLAGGVSPRLMGVQFLNWLTVFQLGVGLAAAVLAVALVARLTLLSEPGAAGRKSAGARTLPPAPQWQAVLAGVGWSGAEEFFWCFLRGAILEVMLKVGAPQTAPAYWAVWLAALLALPTLLGLQPTGALRVGKAAILVVTSALFFYTWNFWLCWAVHALAWELLTPVMKRAERQPAPG